MEVRGDRGASDVWRTESRALQLTVAVVTWWAIQLPQFIAQPESRWGPEDMQFNLFSSGRSGYWEPSPNHAAYDGRGHASYGEHPSAEAIGVVVERTGATLSVEITAELESDPHVGIAGLERPWTLQRFLAPRRRVAGKWMYRIVAPPSDVATPLRVHVTFTTLDDQHHQAERTCLTTAGPTCR